MLREYIKNYLESDRSRSNKSNLIKLLISDIEKFNEIDNFINFGEFKQKLFHYLNNQKERPDCLICKGNVNWNNKDFCYRDHIYPVILGFINNVNAEMISNYKNLQFISHIKNRSKGGRTEMTLIDFYNLLER